MPRRCAPRNDTGKAFQHAETPAPKPERALIGCDCRQKASDDLVEELGLSAVQAYAGGRGAGLRQPGGAKQKLVARHAEHRADAPQRRHNEYQNDTLVIGFADYWRLVYGKGYALTKENGTIKYNKSYGERYQSGLVGSFYITVSPDTGTGYPQISLATSNGTYMTAPTTTDGNGNLVFCSYVIDADGSTHCTDGNYLSMLKFFTGNDYYVSITDSRVVMRKGSLSGQEYCRFEIDNTNHVIKTYMNGTITDANGLPFTLPSSGTVTLENGKISLTGAFDVSNTTVSASDLSGLKGSSNSSYIMFDTELIELVVKAAYKGTIRVACGGSTYGVGETIPGSVFTKSGDGVLSATFEEGFAPRDICTLLKANIFNGIDYAGPTFEIVLERNN